MKIKKYKSLHSSQVMSGCSLLLTLVLMVCVATSFNLSLFQADFYPVMDYAADMLWADVIRDRGFLLVGHYSRFDFNHPGPFWFYWNAMWEQLMKITSLSRFQTWMIGSIAINIFGLAFSGWALSRYLYGQYRPHVSIILFVVTLLLAGGHVFGLWMPLRLIVIYIALTVVLLQLLRGNFYYFPALALFGGMLLHGYVTTPLAIFPIVLGCIALGLKRLDRSLLANSSFYKNIGLSVVIGALFVTPIVWDHLFSDVSNLRRIFKAQDSIAAMSKPSWLDMWRFYVQLLFNQNSSGFVYSVTIISVASLFLSRIEINKGGFGSPALLFAFSSCWLLIYYKTTPAPLYAFTAQYFVGGSVVLVCCILCRTFDSIWLKIVYFNRAKAVISLAIMLGVLFGLAQFVSRNEIPIVPDQRMSEAVPFFTKELTQVFPSSVVISHRDPGHWGLVAGLLLELERLGVKACVARPDMAFLYTREKICSDATMPTVAVVSYSECVDDCLSRQGDWGLVVKRPAQ